MAKFEEQDYYSREPFNNQRWALRCGWERSSQNSGEVAVSPWAGCLRSLGHTAKRVPLLKLSLGTRQKVDGPAVENAEHATDASTVPRLSFDAPFYVIMLIVIIKSKIIRPKSIHLLRTF
jgi:hypothetical protein